MFCDKITPKGKEYSMRKLLVLPIVISMFVVNSASFGATARSARGGANTNNATTSSTGSAPVAARAAVRGAKPASTTAQSAKQSAPVAARAATRNTPKTTTTVKPSAGGAVAARAGAKQKVINMGTKVESATANTVVSEECQNAYYGCMDSFCMLDNISGGRCQCSDRHAELEKVLADIMKLDEQSLLMATEGVERLQMGQNADEIIARAKAAADQVTADNTKKQQEEAKKKRKSLDLSSWTSLSFDDDEDNIFDGLSEDGFKDEMSDKTGDSLHNAAIKLCKAQVPEQCKASMSMLQLTYAQKIKSDCSAYENYLKQQRTKSADKLREAQQALRETALEQFQNENKYDLGGCVLAFRECMQTTGGCGDDFSGCVADTVTLAIDENQDRATSGGKSNAKNSYVTKIKSIKTGVTTIDLDGSTYDILESKKLMCESVLNQCVKVRDGVWDAFLRDIAPTIKAAQVNAESNRRMDCVTVIANCVKKSCGSKWDEESDNYDACINDMEYVKSTCGIEAQKCGNEGITTSLFNYVQQKLSAMKVDRCTTQVKECLQSENACGKDYLGCLGLSANKILDLCPVAKLTSCMEKFNENSAREYVVKVAQGLALNMDNAFAKACQNAVDEAMIKVCGDTETCSGMEIDNSALVDAVFNYKICVEEAGSGKFVKCYPTVEQVTSEDINAYMANWATDNSGSHKRYQPYFFKASLPTVVKMNGTGDNFEFSLSDSFNDNGNAERRQAVEALRDNMNQNLNLILSSIENDATVKACREGLNPQWFTDTSAKTSGSTVTLKNGAKFSLPTFKNITNFAVSNKQQTNARFPNITNNIKQTIGLKFYSKMMNQYNEKLAEMEEKRAADAATLASKYAQTAEEREQACLDMATQKEMDIEAYKVTASAQYNKQTSECTITYTEHKCVDWNSGTGKCGTGYCDHRMLTSTQVCDILKGTCKDPESKKCSGDDHCEGGWICN